MNDTNEIEGIFSLDEKNNDVLKAVYSEELNGAITFECMIENNENTKCIKENSLLLVKVENTFQPFYVMQLIEKHDAQSTKEVICQHALIELNYQYIESLILTQKSAEFALTEILKGTRWKIKTVERTDYHDYTERMPTVLEALNVFFKRWELERIIDVEINGNKITDFYISAVKKRGEYTKKRIEYNKDLTSISRNVDMTNVFTALIGSGSEIKEEEPPTEEVTEGEDEALKKYLDFKDINNGKNYVENLDALQKFGFPYLDESGQPKKMHRFGYFYYQTDDAQTLLDMTTKELERVCTPIIEYDASVIDIATDLMTEHEKITLGMTMDIIDREIDIQIQTRAIKITTDLLKPQNSSIVLGNFIQGMTDTVNRPTPTPEIDIPSFELPENVLVEGDTIRTEWLEGAINALQNAVLGGKGTVSITDTDGILIVDDANNPQKAIKLIGGMIAIANERNLDTGLFNWRTFGTGDGFTADEIKTGILSADRIKAYSLELNKLKLEAVEELRSGLVTTTEFVTVTADIGEIKSSVGKIEKDAEALTERVTTAEQKITDTAITNVVKQNFYTKEETEGAITTKGYVTESEVVQTAQESIFKYNQIGGYNLLSNSTWAGDNFDSWRFEFPNNTSNNSGAFTKYNSFESGVNKLPQPWVMELTAETESDTPWAYSEKFRLSANTNYVFSLWVAFDYTDSIRDKQLSIEFFECDNGISIFEDTTSIKKNSIMLDNTVNMAWKEYRLNVTTLAETTHGFVGLWNATKRANARICVNSLMVQKVESFDDVLKPWSMAENEVFTGITSINKNGVTVGNEKSVLKTHMENTGFSISKGGNIAGEFYAQGNETFFVADNVNATTIEAEEITALNIVNKLTENKTVYVNLSTGNDNNDGTSGKPLRSITEAVNRCPTNLDRFAYEIIISGSGNENLQIHNKHGGNLKFNFQSGCLLESNQIDFVRCTSLIDIVGNSTHSATKDGAIIHQREAGGHLMYFTACLYANVSNITLMQYNGAVPPKNQGYAIGVLRGGSVTVQNVEFDGWAVCLNAELGAMINARNTRGSNNDIYGRATVCGKLFLGANNANNNKIPLCNTFNYYHLDWGHTWGLTSANAVKTAGVHVAPTKPPTTQRTSAFKVVSIKAYENLYGWASVTNEIRQGRADTWQTGAWLTTCNFSNIRDTTTGYDATKAVSGKVTVTRLNTSHGLASGSKLSIYASANTNNNVTGDTLITNSVTINRGQTVTVALSAAIAKGFADGTHKAIKFYYASNSQAYYIRCSKDSLKLELTYYK